jgi:hypothetical protein
MRNRFSRLAPAAALALALVAAGCSDDDDGGPTGPSPDRTYVQIERLANPLVSEVTVVKARHSLYNTGIPSTDVATHAADVQAFITGVAGRDPALARAISGVLLPDMLIVQTDRPGSTAGWLTWALADGYGGRRLTDDVVDAGLMAIFGPLLDQRNVSPGLSTDNVDANDKTFLTTFPYLAPPSAQ